MNNILEKANALLSEMTLKEKIGQMTQSAGAFTADIGNSIASAPIAEQIKKGEIGSTITLGMDVHTIRNLQKIAVEESRLGIPLFFCQDVIHGYQTIFPIPLGWSCSWNPELIEKAVRVSAVEATSTGIMYAFSPMLDIARDPRWGRVSEGGGEDPYLGAQIAKAQVAGYQGKDFSEKDSMIACLKHFVGYGAAEAGRDYNTVCIDDVTLHNTYLPPFQAGIDAGVASVMPAFNIINGIPAAGNRYLLKELLRDEMGFEGITVSDYAAVDEMMSHGVAANGAEASMKAVDATLDIEMATTHFNENLEELVKSGKVDEALIDDAVRRILVYKFKLGLMDDPYKYIRPEEAEKVLFCEEHLDVSRDLGKKSIVMLKNNGVLPLKKEQKIAVIGPKGDSKDMLGTWQFSPRVKETVTLMEGLKAKGLNLTFAQGCDIHTEIENGIEEAVSAAKDADVVLLALGESKEMSGEASSRQNITVPDVQVKLAEAIKALGKPVVLVLTTGRPLLLSWFEEEMDAILNTWFLGSQAGNAIADVLVGDYNPSGKLSITFPRHTGQIPLYYNHFNTGRPYTGEDGFFSKYLDGSNDPLYPFGFGLSYSKFTCSDLVLESDTMSEEKPLSVSVTLKNEGEFAGEETVQLYIRDLAASVVRPVKELKDFQKVTLQPGESKVLHFTLPEEKLRFYNTSKNWVSEEGEFTLFVGTSSDDKDLLTASFFLKK